MGKKSKRNNKAKGGNRKEKKGQGSSTQTPIKKNAHKSKSPLLQEQVRQYKKSTQIFKSGLKRVCGSEFFEKDNLRAFGRAVDFLCQEAAYSQNGDVCADLIPPLRDAIRGRIQVSKVYHADHESFNSHQFFVDCLRDQHIKLEKLASPIVRSLPKAECSHSEEPVASNYNALRDRSGLPAAEQPSLVSYVTNIQESRTRTWDAEIMKCLLTMAVMLSDNKLVVWLLQLSRGPSAEHLMMDTMNFASFMGDLRIIDSLIQLGGRVDGPEYKGETPVFYAAVGGHVEVVKYFVQEHGVDVNKLCRLNDIIDGRPRDGKPLLHHVVNEKCHSKMIDCLLECGADPNLPCANTKGSALHFAAAGPYTDSVRKLLKAGADVSARSGITSETPLHTASMWGHSETVKCLLEEGADVHSQNNIKDMSIHLACEDGHVAVVRALVEFGCNIDVPDGDQNTPLMCAIRNRQTKLARALLAMGANVNASSCDQDTPLILTICAGLVELVPSLLKKGADANASNKIGPVLHKALRQKHFDLVELLLEHGADAMARESDGETPLHSLCRSRDSPTCIAVLLLKHGANVNAKMTSGVTPLYWAVLYGNSALAELLMEQGGDLFEKDVSGVHPFGVAVLEEVWSESDQRAYVSEYMNNVVEKQDLTRLANLLEAFPFLNDGKMMLRALRARNSQMVGLLLDKGFPIKSDETALLLRAVAFQDIHSARVLLGRGAKVECKDEDGYGCVHFAAIHGSLDMTELLLEYKARVNVLTKDGLSPLILHLRGDEAMPSLAYVKLLVENGADGNQITEPIFTPLHGAAYRGYGQIVRYLLLNGADLELRSHEGFTALQYACEQGHLEVAEVLIEHGANVNASFPRSGSSILTHTAGHGHDQMVRLLLRSGAQFDPNALRMALMDRDEAVYAVLKEYVEEENSGAVLPSCPWE